MATYSNCITVGSILGGGSPIPLYNTNNTSSVNQIDTLHGRVSADDGGASTGGINMIHITAPKIGYAKRSDIDISYADNPSTNWLGGGLLKRGQTSKWISNLQHCLKRLGYTSVGAVDGKFGAKTEDAVKLFQGDYSIDVDGLVGTDTKSTMIQALNMG